MGLFKEGRFFSFPTFIAVVFGLGFGASVFLNLQQAQRAETDRKLMQGTIVDLRYQVDQDHKQLAGATSPSPSPSPADTPLATPEPSTSPAPTPAGQVAGASTATLKAHCGNVHQGSPTGHVFMAYTSVTSPIQVTIVGARVTTGYQQITVNGANGYVQADCVV